MIQYPLTTEKCIRLMESENTLVFVVDRKSRKAQIKEAVQERFGVKVTGVRTLITLTGTKKAYVSLAQDTPAIDVATKLGMM
jgi:ribosomal protein uL23